MIASNTQSQHAMFVRYLFAALRGWPLFAVAAVCIQAVPHTPLRALGPLTVALLAGMLARGTLTRAVRRDTIIFVSRTVLRLGVVLTAVRLDGMLLARAGAGPLLVATLAIVAGYAAFALLLRLVAVEPRLGALLAIGTSVCGAAAIVAARPVVQASEEETNVSIAMVSVLGAIASVALIAALSLGWISLDAYGLFAGGSLHEVAHVMAAAAAAPSVIAVATVTKLTRVALLPLALLALPFVAPRRGQRYQRARLHLPGLVVGFFAVAALSTVLTYLTEDAPAARAGWRATSGVIVLIATHLMAAAMAAIGVLVDWSALRRAGARAIIVSVAGALMLGAVILAAANYWGH